jgi:hypothetical protein
MRTVARVLASLALILPLLLGISGLASAAPQVAPRPDNATVGSVQQDPLQRCHWVWNDHFKRWDWRC